ncbi:hypothetical protein EC968_010183 [Mortierella alpina]|nr:hypothetical protein EC968_010183 [Mortierella alpina]
MAPAYNGTKIVMFGTTTEPNPIFILDVKTLVWTKGAEPKGAGPNDDYSRNGAACGVVGDYLIVAGGTMTSSNKQPIVLYNIKLNQWTDSYEPSQAPTLSTGAGNPSLTETASPVAEQGQSSGEGMPSGAKIGVIAAGAMECMERTERDRKNATYPLYMDKNIDPDSSTVLAQEQKGDGYDSYRCAYYAKTSPFRSDTSSQTNAGMSPKSAFEPSEYRQQQQRGILHKAPHEAQSPTPEGQLRIQGARSPQKHRSNVASPSLERHLTPQAARHPQHQTSSIPTVATRRQCTQQEQNLQYFSPSPSITTALAPAHRPQHDLRDNNHDGRHDRSDYRVVYHDRGHDDLQNDRDAHIRAVDRSAADYDRHANDPQACSGDPDDDEEYFAIPQGARTNAPQENGHSSTEYDNSSLNVQRRLDPQDPTRRSAASRLEFYLSQHLNNPQDHGDQVDQDDEALYQEIQRMRALQEEHIRQRLELERVRLEKEAKLHYYAGRKKSPSPRGQH